MDALTVERSIWIAAPRERVWQAITHADQIMQWWGEDRWEIDAREVGGLIRFGFGEDTMTARIAVFDPPHTFRIDWPPQPQYHQLAMTTTYTLGEENGGTRLTVRETGFEHLPDDIRQKRYDSTLHGYETVLASLKAFVRMTDSQSLFHALADPTRRALLMTLAAHSPRTASQLAQGAAITRQGLLKHLDILEAAGLVMAQRQGREKRYHLTPERLEDIEQWIHRLEQAWAVRLERLKVFVEGETSE